MNICIFEDFFISQLHPLNLLRHTSEIICGAQSIKDKIISYSKPANVTLFSRNYIVPYLRKKYPKYQVNVIPRKECTYFNSRVIFTKRISKKIAETKKSTLWIKNGTLVAITAKQDIIEKVNIVFESKATLLNDFKNIEADRIETGDVEIINTPADIINYLDEELRVDLENISKPRLLKKRLHDKMVICDSDNGRIHIGKDTKIEPFCYIKGPVYIGSNTLIRSGSRIYGPVYIGDKCKVSGEVTSSVLHSFVNKQHYGFLGHSYLCEWVNLGAGTTTSNLKNNYSNVKLDIEGKQLDSKTIFAGSFIGDHSKTGINTMLNTGSVIGISCNLFGSGYHEKSVNSFSWCDASAGKVSEYNFDKAVQTAVISMKRRKVKMSDVYKDMLLCVFKNKG